jgi:hypothetical protein
MTLRVKLELLAGVLVLIIAAIAGRAWLSEHDARLRAESDAHSRQEAFDKAGEQMKAEKAADLERDKQTAASLAQIAAAAAAQRTPAQIASWIPTQLPTPQPITITVPPATPANPTPDAIASIPQADLPALRDSIANCQRATLEATSCKADLASRDREGVLAQKQIEALKGEVQDWKKAAGKTFWSRTWQYTQIAVAGGLGYAIGHAAHK